jgi:hypothetical protein
MSIFIKKEHLGYNCIVVAANDNVVLLHDSFEFFENDTYEDTEYAYDAAGTLGADVNKGISAIWSKHFDAFSECNI